MALFNYMALFMALKSVKVRIYFWRFRNFTLKYINKKIILFLVIGLLKLNNNFFYL